MTPELELALSVLPSSKGRFFGGNISFLYLRDRDQLCKDVCFEFVNISGANLIGRLGPWNLVKSTRGEPGFESKIVDDK